MAKKAANCYHHLNMFWVLTFNEEGQGSKSISIRVLKPGPARWVDPGLGPVRVEAKTYLGIGPGKPGRPGTRSTRSNRVRPGLFFLYINSY